jgi:hypothetical protein
LLLEKVPTKTDLGIWRKAVAVAVAAPVVALGEREGGRLGEHARGTNNPVWGWPVQGVQQRGNAATARAFCWTWAVNCSDIFLQILIIFSF